MWRRRVDNGVGGVRHSFGRKWQARTGREGGVSVHIHRDMGGVGDGKKSAESGWTTKA